MKKVILISLICFVSIILYSQKLPADQVPALLSEKIAIDFPGAEQVKWEKKKQQYKAEFKIGKISHDMWLSADGKISKHRTEVKKGELPAAIRATIKKDFSTYTIGDSDKTEESGAVSYKVELKSEAGKKSVRFTAEGKAISKKE